MVVAADGGHAERRRIKLGARNAEQVEVLAGLKPGERVITSDYAAFEKVEPRGPDPMKGRTSDAEARQGLARSTAPARWRPRRWARSRWRSRAGEFVAIMGPSGCGKSTLLNMLGLLDSPSGRRLLVLRRGRGAAIPSAQLTRLRRERIGFVFQSFNLIDDLTVAENVEVALLYRQRAGGRAAAAGARGAGAGRHRPPRRPPPAAALRRPAAARRGGPRAGLRPQPDPRRRAHRQPRHRQRRGGDGPADRRGEGRRHRGDGHPLAGPRRRGRSAPSSCSTAASSPKPCWRPEGGRVRCSATISPPRSATCTRNGPYAGITIAGLAIALRRRHPDRPLRARRAELRPLDPGPRAGVPDATSRSAASASRSTRTPPPKTIADLLKLDFPQVQYVARLTGGGLAAGHPARRHQRRRAQFRLGRSGLLQGHADAGGGRRSGRGAGSARRARAQPARPPASTSASTRRSAACCRSTGIRCGWPR